MNCEFVDLTARLGILCFVGDTNSGLMGDSVEVGAVLRDFTGVKNCLQAFGGDGPSRRKSLTTRMIGKKTDTGNEPALGSLSSPFNSRLNAFASTFAACLSL
jgi:hypothetical protein